METMKVCDKCGKLMSFNSHFDGYYCTSCGQFEKKASFRKAYRQISSPKSFLYMRSKVTS